MKLETAIEIIDNMYQNKMDEREEKTKNGVIIHLGQDINFTELEEASVRVLREVLNLKRKIKDKIEEVKSRPNNPKQEVLACQIDATLITCLEELLE